MRSKRLLVIVSLCSVAAIAFAYFMWDRQTRLHYMGGPTDKRVVSAHTAFGFDLLHRLADKPGENVFFSPSSVAAALEMTHSGAAGQTEAEMAKALHLDGLSVDALNHGNQSLQASFGSADPKVEISIANSLWAQDGYPFLPAFIERNKRFYSAEVTNLDFRGPDAPARINGWVRDKTNGKIDNLVGPLDSLTRLVLVNAVYFHGQWKEKFDKQATHIEPFMQQNGESKDVQTMCQSGKYTHLKGDGFEAVRLPYGSDRLAMYVFLPTERHGLPAFISQLGRGEWDSWIGQMQPMAGFVSLPRFKVEYGKTLNEPLKALGIHQAFDASTADFSGMTDKRDLYVSLVQHKAYVDVDEEGTEAAAATHVEMRTLGMGPRGPSIPTFVMIVDHPFLCVIRDDKSGEILFLGAIYDPTAA